MSQKLKKRIFDVLEITSSNSYSGHLFVVFITTLILLNLLSVSLETIDYLFSKYSTAFKLFELFSLLIFTIEYVLRIWTCTSDEKFKEPFLGRLHYALTPLALIDLISILPFYLPILAPYDLRFMRTIRLFRVFRIFKMARYSQSIKKFGNVFSAKKEELIISVCIVFILLVFSSSLMYIVEHDTQPKSFPNIPETLWWSVVTLTTVGYGDVYPVTSLGKVIAGILALLGIGMVALPTGILASGFSEELKKDKIRKITCPHCGQHIE